METSLLADYIIDDPLDNGTVNGYNGLHPIQGGLFRGCSRMGGATRPHPPPYKICQTYPTKMKPGTVIPYLKETQKKI